MTLIINNDAPVPLPFQDWQGFEGVMANDPAYLRLVSATSAKLAASRLEGFIIAGREDAGAIRNLWNLVRQGTPEAAKPAVDDVVRWNDLAQQYSMPFDFDDDGYLMLKDGADEPS
ncbi:MAG: hypothetical protein AAFR99_05755 [Cyanobacteria bacterium J06629_9]